MLATLAPGSNYASLCERARVCSRLIILEEGLSPWRKAEDYRGNCVGCRREVYDCFGLRARWTR